MRRILKLILAAVFAAVIMVAAYLLLWPTPLDPYAWTPPVDPGTGPGSPFTPTQRLSPDGQFAGTVIQSKWRDAGRPENFGPEDVTVRPGEGRIYTGIGDGSILSIDPASGETQFFANTGGRPLGVTFDADGNTLFVADAKLGLLAVDRAGFVSVLANEADGEPVTFADNLDLESDGTVWFSAPTREHTLAQVELDVWNSRPTGRLLRYDRKTKSASVVLDNLFYANGVAVAQDDSFVLVAEFLAFRITRYWLRGERAGTHEVFVDGLPGYPDNITRTPDGHFLVGLSLQRLPGLDQQRPHPSRVEVIYRLPAFLKPKPQYPGYLLEFDANGRLLRFAADERGEVTAQVTAGVVLTGDGGVERTAEVVVGSLLVPSLRKLQLRAVDSEPRAIAP
jgi:sugar lactone lactonase YvrE